MEIPYDSLIVAAGGRTSYFGNDQFAPFAPGMKTIDDALELRRRIFGAFELAELEEDPEEKRRWLTFVVVGAGPTGCELAGQIRELAERSLRHNFRTIDPATAKVILIDGGEKPLASFGENLSGKGRKELEHMGVELRMGLRATDVDFNGLDVKTPDSTERIHAHTVIWAAGVAASPLAKMLGDASGAEVDRAGRVAVLPDCTLPGHPEVFAIGDMMSLDHLPGVAEVAMQQGLFAGRTIRRRLQGGGDKTVTFKYVDLGSMATIGRFRAVVEFKGIHLSGFAGWLMWLAVHLVFLTGFRNRLGALFRWTGALLGRHREERAFTVRRASTGDDSYASVIATNDARREQRHDAGDDGDCGEERRQRDRVLQRPGAERGDAVAELVRGDEPTGGDGDELGERRLAVPDRHGEEARAGETGEGEDDDPVRLVGQRRDQQQRARDPPRQHEVDRGRRQALRCERDQEPPDSDGGPERRQRIVGGGCWSATVADQGRAPVAEHRLADAVRDQGRREQPEHGWDAHATAALRACGLRHEPLCDGHQKEGRESRTRDQREVPPLRDIGEERGQ